MDVISARVQLRHGTEAQWIDANPVLGAGEPGVETDTGQLKVGDGVTAWSALPYILDESDLASKVDGGTGPLWAALREALVPRPSGGTDGQALVKSGDDIVWGAAGLTAEEIAADPTVRATFGLDWQPRTFCALGDSITADGGRVQNGSAAPAAAAGRYSWHLWGQILADSRMVWGGSFGAASQTIAQLKNTYLPYILALANKPHYCVLLAGQNDLGSVTAATFTDYTSIVDQLRAAGITPILCTLTPSTTARTIHALNSHIRTLAAAYGLPLVDLCAAVIDQPTGVWKAALTRDGIHPNEKGASVLGQALADVLTALQPVNPARAWLPRTAVGYGGDRTETGGQSNVLLLVDNGGTPPKPNGWDTLVGEHATAISLSTPGGDVAGRRATFTASSSQLIARWFASTSSLAGDDMVMAFRLSATVEASAGSWGFAIIDSGGANIYDMGRNSGNPLKSDLAPHIFAVPFNAIGPGVYLDFVINGSGASVSVSEPVLLNLTALGLP